MPPTLELRGIHKHFGSVHALRGVDFALEQGEVHALVGENGAGKSTLMHLAFGLIQPDRGQILLRGLPCPVHSPREARRLGLGMVHQHFTSIAALTVAENLALSAGWGLRPNQLAARVRSLVARVGLELDPAARVEGLSVGLRQRLEILKALATDARILLLDEPTAVLAPQEADELFGVIRRFTRSGGAAVLITHKLHEALRWADRITVLRRGQVRFTGRVAGQLAGTVAAHMIGDAGAGAGLEQSRAASEVSQALIGEVRVRAERLLIPAEGSSSSGVGGASLVARSGEIVGLAGVEGNGQRELLRAIAGLLPHSGGVLEVLAPVGFVPEDRTIEGLIPEFSLADNLALGLGRQAPWVHGPWIDWSRAERRAAELIRQFGIQATGPSALAAELSGGNQQKLVIARALESSPAVLVAENPTRGLDLSATAEVHQRLRRAAGNGMAVLFYSSDLDEVLGVADRIYVMANGVSAEAPPDAGRAEVGGLMLRAKTGTSR